MNIGSWSIVEKLAFTWFIVHTSAFIWLIVHTSPILLAFIYGGIEDRWYIQVVSTLTYLDRAS